ncbi:MAG: T9SS type A sorting domain-containing protein [Flavobacteriales bacterium]|nr:T9SS type A sorting domain-containing protein [Flavobacteriales bacterium]
MKTNYLTYILAVIMVFSSQVKSQTSLVAAYEFNSNLNDASGSNLHLINSGGVYASDRFGTPLSAFDFSSITAHCNTASTSVLPAGGDARAVSLWFKINAATHAGSNAILSWGNTSTSGAFGVALGTSWGTLAGINVFGWGNDALFNYTYNFTDWYHLVVNYDGDTVKVYVNATLIGSSVKSSWNTASPSDLHIAETPSPGDPFGGLIDDIYIFDNTLTQTEIDALYNGIVNYQTHTLCFGDTLWLDGNPYTASGTYAQVFQDTAGPDSTVFHQLVFQSQISVQSTHHMCLGDSVTFNGVVYTTAGTYVDSAVSVIGCDSLNVLNLFTYTPTTTNTTMTICDGDSFAFGSQVLTNPGTYYDSLSNFVGCDSTVELVLTVEPLPQVTLTESNDSLIATAGFAAYIWYLDGIQISGAGGPTHIPTQNGDYTVEVVDAFSSCLGLSNTVNISGLTNGLNEYDLLTQNFKIFPNPTQEQFTLSGDVKIDYIELIDLTGKRLLSQNVNSTAVNVDANLEAGTYMIKIFADEKVGFMKVIVQ